MTTPRKEVPRTRYWRSLNELQQRPEFEQWVDREFPVAASEYPEGVSRRRWMQLMGASFALTGMAGCRYPEEVIAPFVIRPEGRVPGERYQTATNIELAGRVHHLLVSMVDGRPIKIEPNDEHPARVGTDVYAQASILGLYDPDRQDGVVRQEEGVPEASSWEEFERFARRRRRRLEADSGAGFAVVMPPTRSPSVVAMLQRLREAYPEVVFCRYDAVADDVMRRATRQALGREALPLLELENARVVFSLQADLLGQDPGMLRNAYGYGQAREPIGGRMSQLYVVESSFTTTGMMADGRLALRPSQMPALLVELERRIDAIADGEAAEYPEGERPIDEVSPEERLERFLDVLARELVEHRGEGIVAVGEHLGPEAVAAGIRLNAKLGNLNQTVRYAPVADAEFDAIGLAEFAERAQGGDFSTVLVLGGNPVYTAPGDVDLAAALERVDEAIYLGEYSDETAVRCSWWLPQAHPLESWGDSLSDEGRYAVSQPLIRPLLDGRTAPSVMAEFLDGETTDPERIVRRTATAVAGGSLSDREWRQLLHDGFLPGLGLDVPAAELAESDAPPLTDAPLVLTEEVDRDDIEIVFVPGEGVYDGRFANNGWLQELPQSATKLTWDNAAVMSPRTARALGVGQERFVALRIDEDTSVELPVFEMPGHADGTVTVAYGYGRTRAGAVGGHEDMGAPVVGFDVRTIRTTERMLVAYRMEARPRTETYPLATAQDHFAIDERGQEELVDRAGRLVREGTLELFEKDAHFTDHLGVHHPPLEALWTNPLEEFKEDAGTPQWGMAIDLNKCIACNACVIACQSENNVPIVGKDQVAMGREMHWLRIDRYFNGNEDQPQILTEPVACVHCDMAPCESVCPVAATVQTDEGINAMAYNRCIGTRYCANNCPYKVRRFNYFNFNEKYGSGYAINGFPERMEKANRKLQALVLNPEVTVRGRGVMEKCTYCIQRTERAKIEARKDGGRAIRDGDVRTACQQACPTRAIVFGNLRDEDAEVVARHRDPRAYRMLEHLNTRPRTAHLARIRNPHPRLMTADQIHALETAGEHHGAGHGEEGHGEEGHEDAASHAASQRRPPLAGQQARTS